MAPARSQTRRSWSSSVDNGHLPDVARRKGHEGVAVHEGAHVADRAIAHQNIAAGSVLAPHFIRVAEGIIGAVDDDLGVVVRIGAAVCADEAASAVVFRGPGT